MSDSSLLFDDMITLIRKIAKRKIPEPAELESDDAWWEISQEVTENWWETIQEARDLLKKHGAKP